MNRKIFIRLVLLFIVNTLLFSCGTQKAYRYIYPPTSYCELINGYWGEWAKLEYLLGRYYNVQTKYNAQTLEILIYYKENHPSNFKAKIIIDKRTGVQKDKTWTSYQGTITASVPSRLGYSPMAETDYQLKLLQTNALEREANVDILNRSRDIMQTINCEIRCDANMQKAIRNNGLLGVINLFYSNGRGEAITFR